ncbi:MAG TPA: cytochrome c [Gemmataceae bacterium]|nr:cytochrome c [Gemmataceae bacterium]
MKRRAAITCTAVLLALGLWSITALSADDEDEKKAIAEAQKAVLKLVDSMNGKGGDVKGQIAAIKKKFEELKPIMMVYKPRKKGGIGMGKDSEDDIEQTIGKMGGPKYKMTPKKLADMKADLIMAGELSKAIAEIAGQDQYAKQYAKKDAAKWKGYIKEMKKGSDELIAAVKGGNAAKVKTAANNLSASCTSCHSDFRE